MSIASRLTNMQAPEIASTSTGSAGTGSLWSKKSANAAGKNRVSLDSPNARNSARCGVGNTRRPPGCSLPSGLHRKPPTMPIDSELFKVSIRPSSASEESTVSGLRKRMCGAAEKRTPILHAAANPRLEAFRTIINESSALWHCSTVAKLQSRELLSTTITVEAPAAKADSTQALRNSPAL